MCGIQGEALKAGGEVIVKWLQENCNMVWRTGVAPLDWWSAIIVPIYKKGSRKVCKNYRGISLLSVPGMLFGKVLNNRVRRVKEGEDSGRAGGIQESVKSRFS